MLYFVQTAMFFEESSLDELKEMTGFKIVDRQLNLFVIDAKQDLLKKIKQNGTTFVLNAFKIEQESTISKTDYLGSIYKTVKKGIKGAKIGKDQTIRLECYDINNRKGYSAKDLEVKIGQHLIKDGYNADLINPSIFVYFILLNDECYVGHEEYVRNRVLNPLRYAQKEKKISRSEAKLRQAFDAFQIKGSGIAIDLGAAPGGWTRFLAKKGYKVVAVDIGELNYKYLKDSGLKVEKVDLKSRQFEKKLMENDIIHIKAHSDDALSTLRIRNADILTDDMNIDCESTIKEVKRYSKFLKKGAILILTIKCITRNAPKYIKEAHKLLKPKFAIHAIKVLPSNRQELTVLAKLNS